MRSTQSWPCASRPSRAAIPTIRSSVPDPAPHNDGMRPRMLPPTERLSRLRWNHRRLRTGFFCHHVMEVFTMTSYTILAPDELQATPHMSISQLRLLLNCAHAWELRYHHG